MPEYKTTTPAPAAEWHQTTPTRPPSIRSDVLVPIMRALAGGILVASAIIAGLWASQLDAWPWRAWLAASLTLAAIIWLWESRGLKATLWAWERRLQIDLDRDGSKGPPPPALVINARAGEITTQAQAETELLERLHAFLAACIAADDTTEATWVPATLDRDTYVRFRDALIHGSYARWRGRRVNAGWTIYPGLTANSIMAQMLRDRPGLLTQITP